MLLSIALILLLGMLLGNLCLRLKLPALLGMLAAGIILGPYGSGLLDPKILSISAEIRKIALIIILARAGLGLDLSGLKMNGRPAAMMCFVPATFELLGVLLFGPKLLGLTVMEAAVLGSVLAAVSPAVVVPRMIRLTEEKYGTGEGIPQLILAGASVDDVYVIVLFSAFTGMMQGKGVSVLSFINIPVSIALGALIGTGTAYIMKLFFERTKLRATAKAIVFLCISFLLVSAEDALKTGITFSALIAVMFIGIGLRYMAGPTAAELSAKLGKLWVGGEIFLFVLVGACVNIGYLGKVGPAAVLLIIGALVFRMAGVYTCVLGSKLNAKERLFAMLAYTPKATVQAAIGGIPLAMGLDCGDTVLTAAVLAIVLTAPLGAFAIDSTYRKLLKKQA